MLTDAQKKSLITNAVKKHKTNKYEKFLSKKLKEDCFNGNGSSIQQKISELKRDPSLSYQRALLNLIRLRRKLSPDFSNQEDV